MSIATPQAEIAAPSTSEPVSPATPSVAEAMAALMKSPSLANEMGATLFSAPKQASPSPIETHSAAPVETVEVDPAPTLGETPVTTAEPNATESPEATVSEPAVEPVEPSITDPVTGKKLLPNRISTKQFDTIEQEAIALKHELAAKGQNITLLEACQRVDAKYNPPVEADLEPAGESFVQAPTIPSLQAEIDGLKTKIREAGKEGSLFNDELAEANINLAEKLQQLSEAKRSQKTIIGQRTANFEEVKRMYPTADDPSSALGSQVVAVIEEARSNKQLAHILEGPDAPSKTVALAVDRLSKSLKALGLSDALIAQATSVKVDAADAPAPAVVQKQAATTTAEPKSVPRGAAVAAPGSASVPAKVPTITPAQALKAMLLNPTLANKALGGQGGGLLFGS